MAGGLNLGVSLVADRLVDVCWDLHGDAREELGAVEGKVAINLPAVPEI